MIYSCCSDNRRVAILGSPDLNGIDYLEVMDSDAVALGSPAQQTLLVRCLRPVPSGLTPANILVEGGESITGIVIDWVAPASPPPALATPREQAYFTELPDGATLLVIRVATPGDFSTYTLRLVNDATQAAQDAFAVTEPLAGFDPQMSEVQFSFKVECGAAFDCETAPSACLPSAATPPPIDYLAKDYGSFRTLLLDRINQLVPGWAPASEADLGVILAELIAYAGDQLSYQQDAVATEAYLQTARSRISLRRHARLVGYQVHEGCNARAFIQFGVTAQVAMDRAQTRVYTRVPGGPATLAGNEEAAVLAGVQVFEPMQDAVLYPEHNQIALYTWGAIDCCLSAGATEATLAGTYPNLRPGDVLLFKEVVGPQTGFASDADIRHRCAVRLTQVVTLDSSGQTLVDPLFEEGTGLPIVSGNQKPTPVTAIQWSLADALPFPVCVSSTFIDSNGDRQSVTGVSVALGNVVLADHGLSFAGIPLGTVPPPRLFYPAGADRDQQPNRCQLVARAPVPVRFRPSIPDSPITQAVPLPSAGSPITQGIVALSAAGPVSLADSSGNVSLLIQPANLFRWPQNFGIKVAPNSATASNFDLSIVYNSTTPIVMERFTDLSFSKGDVNYVAARINLLSKLITVPDSYAPPSTTPSAFATGVTPLTDTGTLTLNDASTLPYLIVQTIGPASWARLFGIIAQGSQQETGVFSLAVVYQPSSRGVGVNLPVTLEQFDDLTLAGAAGQLNSVSHLIVAQSFVSSPGLSLSARDLMSFDPGNALPEIALQGSIGVAPSTTWMPRQDLLLEPASSPAFVVEVESSGAATLRFGDNINGRRPQTGTSFTAAYRIGNGSAGNVGPESLIGLSGSPLIASASNPLPAYGGSDPETADQIRRRAPQAFQTQARAVTMQDYKAIAESFPQVNQAVATLRWTGSWHTVFLTAEPTGGGNLQPALRQNLKSSLERYRLIGQDLQIEPPQFVSLEIELEVCIFPGYFQSHVERSLLAVLGSGTLPSGGKGLFYPDSTTFGQTVYLSPIYAAARSVAGVVSASATKFQPQGVNSSRFLLAGKIELGPYQVARLQNDPRLPGHGRLTLILKGGR